MKDDAVNVNLPAGTVVSDAAVQGYVNAEMNAGRLDPPDANKFYVVMMPSKVSA